MRQVYRNDYRMQGESTISASDNIIALATDIFKFLEELT